VIQLGFPSAAISSVNLHHLFSKCSEFASLETLEEGQREVTQGQTCALFSLQEKVQLIHCKKWLVKTNQSVVNAVSVSPCCMSHYVLYVGIEAQ